MTRFDIKNHEHLTDIMLMVGIVLIVGAVLFEGSNICLLAFIIGTISFTAGCCLYVSVRGKCWAFGLLSLVAFISTFLMFEEYWMYDIVYNAIGSVIRTLFRLFIAFGLMWLITRLGRKTVKN